MANIFSLLKTYPRTWLKVYDESGKEQKCRFLFEQQNNGFMVTAYHMAEEHDSRRCQYNYNKAFPCICTSSYMLKRCMEKQFFWNPKEAVETYSIIGQLADFEDDINCFTHKELTENYEKFKKAFEYNCVKFIFMFVSDTTSSETNTREVVFRKGDKLLKLIFDTAEI